MASPSTKAVAEKEPAQRMLKFINYAWTPYHAVEALSKKLLAAGYVHILERDEWKLEKGGKYFFTRNQSSIVAFAVGKKYEAGNGVYMVGAHTDSPCLKVKPVSKGEKSGFGMVNVETYGGGLWQTWFDRELSVAGRALVREENGKLSHRLVKIEKPILRIPMLAIHLNRSIRDSGFKPNPQNELTPILAASAKSQLESPMGTVASPPAAKEGQKPARHHTVLLQCIADQLGCAIDDVVDIELNICDVQPGQLWGVQEEWVAVGRLDNLSMSWCSMQVTTRESVQALLESTEAPDALDEEAAVRAVALFDHEEVGSASAVGAGGPLMRDTIVRVSRTFSEGAPDAIERCLQRSFLVSADMAHALHPNYPDKHEPDHQPKFNNGLVIKYNQNQRYATNSVTATLFKEVGARRGIPCQAFVVRNDMPCGSTIGPILSSGLGVRTVDVGSAQLAMHSVREMCATADISLSVQHFRAFFEDFGAVDATLDVDACLVQPDGEIDNPGCDCADLA